MVPGGRLSRRGGGGSTGPGFVLSGVGAAGVHYRFSASHTFRARPDFAPAPSGTRARFGTTPQHPPGSAYLTGKSMSQFTSRAPGE
jgi:hypothetical protein